MLLQAAAFDGDSESTTDNDEFTTESSIVLETKQVPFSLEPTGNETCPVASESETVENCSSSEKEKNDPESGYAQAQYTKNSMRDTDAGRAVNIPDNVVADVKEECTKITEPSTSENRMSKTARSVVTTYAAAVEDEDDWTSVKFDLNNPEQSNSQTADKETLAATTTPGRVTNSVNEQQKAKHVNLTTRNNIAAASICADHVVMRHSNTQFSEGKSESMLSRNRSNPTIVAVMGLTGSGKSHFIAQLTGDKSITGDSLESVTQKVSNHNVIVEGQKLVIVDTPGMNDTHRSDSVVLKEIADCVKWCYEKEMPMLGIIYMHDITQERMSGSAVLSLEIFKEVCGEDFYKNMVFVANRWDKTTKEAGRKKLKQLKEKYWKPMINGGASVVEYNGSKSDAESIMAMMMTEKEPALLKLGKELVEEEMRLVDTAAGRIADRQLAEKREKYHAEIARIESAIKRALDDKNKEMEEDLKKEAEERQMAIQRLQKEAFALREHEETVSWMKWYWFVRLRTLLSLLSQTTARVFQENNLRSSYCRRSIFKS